MSARRSVPRLLVLAAATAALVLAFSASALALGPSDPILSFSDLRSELASAPGGQLTGYMKTVVKGSDITTIPLAVTGVPIAGGPDDDLIMFEATGTLIAKYGGIVAGMSGSPIYVNDGGTDKLVGAVSYGDYFTLGGTGLATPIEAMTHIEDNYATAVVPLSAPIITPGGVVNKIIVAPDPQNYEGASKMGAFVAKPLTSVFIGGLKPSSTGYKALAKDLSARGISTVSLSAPLVSGGGDESAFSTEMTAGASIAALASRGDMWVGGVGTVTYADTDNVLAFGHPAFWSGTSALYMANAWVENIWPNSFEPYKVADPGKVRGAIVQDRNAGIMGKKDVFPTETTITATAHCGSKTTTSAVYIPRQLIVNGFADYELVGEAAYVAGSKLFDQEAQPGSVHTTTTVDVADRHGTVHHIVMPNYTDSDYDIASAAMSGVLESVASLQSVLEWGVDDPKILSVDVTADYSTTRTGATIVGVQLPNGLHHGANRVRIQAVVYGMDDTQTVDATLTVPANTALGGNLIAADLSEGSMEEENTSYETIFTEQGLMLLVNASRGRESIAQLSDDLNHFPQDTTIKLILEPENQGGGSDGADSGGGMPSMGPSLSTDPIVVNVTAPWPIVPSLTRTAVTAMDAAVEPGTIPYGGSADVVGEIDGPSDPTTVSLYAQVAGDSTETLVATQTATSADGALQFDFPLDEVFTNTTYRVHIDDTDGWSGADETVLLRVRAIASLSTSASRIKPGKRVTLRAMVIPVTAGGGTAVFEQLVGRTWKKIASKTLVSSGSVATTSISFKPTKGTHKVRMRYLGGTFNYAATSGTRTITAK